MAKKAKSKTPATAHLNRAGADYKLHDCAFDADGEGIGIAAARSLGVDCARVFKTLIVACETQDLAMAMIPVEETLDLKAAAVALGVKKAAMAEIAQAERATGYIKGGISPFGQKKKLGALIDDSAMNFDTIYLSGGQRGLEIEIAPQFVLTLLGAKAVPLARTR